MQRRRNCKPNRPHQHTDICVHCRVDDRHQDEALHVVSLGRPQDLSRVEGFLGSQGNPSSGHTRRTDHVQDKISRC